jgi:hypothetical protein
LSSARLEPPSPMFAEMSPRKSPQALTARSPSAAARTWGRPVSKYPSTISVPPGRNSSIAHRYGSTLAIRLNRAPIPVFISCLVDCDVRAAHSQGKASIMPNLPVRQMVKNRDRRRWLKTSAPGECDSERGRGELHIAADTARKSTVCHTEEVRLVGSLHDLQLLALHASAACANVASTRRWHWLGCATGDQTGLAAEAGKSSASPRWGRNCGRRRGREVPLRTKRPGPKYQTRAAVVHSSESGSSGHRRGLW